MTISPAATDAPEAFGCNLPSGIERQNLERARQYLAAIEGSTTHGTAFAFLAPDICQIEYPNQFVPKGAERDLAAMRDAAERGRRVGNATTTASNPSRKPRTLGHQGDPCEPSPRHRCFNSLSSGSAA